MLYRQLINLIWFAAVALADIYNKIDQTDVGCIEPSLIIHKSNAEPGCLRECNSRVYCNLVTHIDPNICHLFYVLKSNRCIKNYMLHVNKTVGTTTLYVKARKTIGQSCKQTKQCMTEFGLTCLTGKCICLNTS